MSESISTPVATPAPAPAVIPSGADSGGAPPPASQQGISVSEAARLLNQQRRAGPQPPPPPQAPPRPNGQQAPPSSQQPPAAPPAPATPAPTDSIAKALGLPDTAPAAPGEAPVPPGASIEVDGQRLTAEQVRRALAHQSDYTQKTQQLAAERAALQQQAQALATVLPYLQPEIERVRQQLAGVPQPDLSLIESNPQEYLRQRAQYEQSLQEQGRLGRLTELQQQAAAQAMSEQVARSNEELSKQFPQWADPKTRAEWQQQIAEWAENEAGFKREELRRLSDHRQLTVMMKAMAFDAYVKGSKTTTPVAAAPVRGSTPPAPPAQRVSQAETAFEAKPNFRNAAALLTARRAGAR